MADWSKLVFCPNCGAGNPCDEELCMRCHVCLQHAISATAKKRAERAERTRHACTLQRVAVSIPPEVADFMAEVWTMIQCKDERVEKVTDDSIQAPNIAPIIGGVIDPKAKYFSFSYTPCNDPLTRWKLALFDNEIEDIAKRHVTTLSLWKCAQESCHHLFTNKSDGYCKCNPFGWKSKAK